MFLGEWHRRSLGFGLPETKSEQSFPLQEKELGRKPARPGDCQLWSGSVSDGASDLASKGPARASSVQGDMEEKPLFNTQFGSGSPTMSSTSGESFDMLHAAEAEKSAVFDDGDEGEDDGERFHELEKRYHGHPRDSMIKGNTLAFDKM